MQKYLNYLLQDIAAAARDNHPSLLPDEDDFDAHIAEVERFVNDEPSLTLAQHTELQKIEFPPVDRLADEHCTAIINALQTCFSTYNIALDIPEGIPAINAYPVVIETLDKPVFAMQMGVTHIDFCSYDPDDHCPFDVEDCPCQKMWREEGI